MRVASRFVWALAMEAFPQQPCAFVDSSDLRDNALQQIDRQILTVPPELVVPVEEPKVPTKKTVSIHAGPDTQILDSTSNDEALSLGEPISFETPLFKGQILIRLKNVVESDADPVRHSQYFSGRSNRLMQSVVQGKFKKAAKMSDIYVGSVCGSPFAKKPPGLVCKILEKAFRQVQPGAVVDLGSQTPKIMALYSGSAQSIRKSEPEEEDLPDIRAKDIEEDFSPYHGSAQQRQRELAHPRHARQYEFDTHHVYTFHTFNEVLDFGLGEVHVPFFGAYDMKPLLGAGQPFPLSAVSSAGETMFHFEIRHQ